MGTSVEHAKAAETSAVGVQTRKRRTIQEKLRIVRETLHAQASVAVIARRHGINANQVFAWRRQYQRGQLVEGSGAITQEPVVVPVRIAELSQVQEVEASTRTAEPIPRASLAPRIEIELTEGPRLKIWDISSETLRALIRDLVRPC
jgi:transposase-like protein